MDNHFYVTGGTLPLDATSYVVRQADTDLLAGLRRSDFCYVLDTRQMGKSSLMVRTTRQLHEEGCRVIVLDLTAVGQNLQVEQWYFGLLSRAAAQIEDYEDRLLDFWRSHRQMGPMQRFIEALRVVLLTDDAATPCPKLVIFIDEIDAVRSLPFSADEFFAGIRECYNRRSHEPVFERLTFCLLGVATPADLVRDTRISPFNIGRRIELQDFTPDETGLLAGGLLTGSTTLEPFRHERARRLLHRIFYWTNGHPYVTQRLCQAVAERAQRHAPAADMWAGMWADITLVDATCDELFLTQAAREADDNLTFVSSRLLRSEADVSGLLDLYEKVRMRRRVRNDETNPLCNILQLSGVVTVDKGMLKLRNRVYDQVFDAAWVRSHLPDAELRRQQQAYRRGLVRATLVGTAGLAIVSSLAAVALHQVGVAHRFAVRAAQQETLARDRLSRMYVASGIQAMESGDASAALAPLAEAMLLQQDDPERLQIYRRRFAAALMRSPHLDQVWFADKSLRWAAFNPDHRFALAAGDAGRIYVWEVKSRQELPLDLHQEGAIRYAAFNPAGTRLVTCGNEARVWDFPSGHLLCTLAHPGRADKRSMITYASWSRDGNRLATASYSTFAVWDLTNLRPQVSGETREGFHADGGARILQQNTQDFEGAELERGTLSPDGKSIALVSGNYRGQVYKVPENREAFSIGYRAVDGTWNAYHTTYSASGQYLLVAGVFQIRGGNTLISGGGAGGAGLFDAATGKRIRLFLNGDAGMDARGYDVAFSPDERRIVTASADRTARLWDVATGKLLIPPLRHNNIVTHAAFSASGKRLVTASADGAVSVWDAATGAPVCAPLHHAGAVVAAQFGADDHHILTASQDGTTRLWSLPSEGVSSDALGTRSSSYMMLPFQPRFFQVRTAPTIQMTLRATISGSVLAQSTASLPSFARARYSKDRKRVLLISNKGEGTDTRRSFQVWDTEKVQPVSPVWRTDNAFLSHNGKLLLLLDNEGTYRLVGGERTLLWRTHSRVVKPGYLDGCTFFTSDDTGVVIAEDPRSLRVWDTRTGQPRTPLLRHEVPVAGFCFSPDERYLFTANTATEKGSDEKIEEGVDDGKPRNLLIWNIPDGTLAAGPMLHTFLARMSGICFSADGRYAITPSIPYASVWSLDGSRTLVPRNLGIYQSSPIYLSPDGETFVTVDRKDWLWSTHTTSSITPASERTLNIVNAVFSPDSQSVLAIREDGIARIWDVASRRPITPPLTQNNNITQAIYSADGRLVATAGSLGDRSTVKVWDAKTGEAILPALAMQGYMGKFNWNIGFTLDGERLIAVTQREQHTWALPTTGESVLRMQARAQLLSGQRIDPTTGTMPIDTAALQTAWKRLQEAEDQ